MNFQISDNTVNINVSEKLNSLLVMDIDYYNRSGYNINMSINIR